MAYREAIDSTSSCGVDPLFRALELSHDAGERSYEVGVMHLKKNQERYIQKLDQTRHEQDAVRKQESSVSLWKRIGNFVNIIFTALALVAGISAAAAGAPVLGAAIVVACVWRIGALLVQSLNKQQAILDALVPQELAQRKQICRVIEISAQTVDITAQLIMAIGSGWAALKIAEQYKNVFQLASFVASSAQGVSHGVISTKQSKAGFLRAELATHKAQNDHAKRQMDQQRSDLERLSAYLKDLSKTVGSALESDHGAKYTIFNEA